MRVPDGRLEAGRPTILVASLLLAVPSFGCLMSVPRHAPCYATLFRPAAASPLRPQSIGSKSTGTVHCSSQFHAAFNSTSLLLDQYTIQHILTMVSQSNASGATSPTALHPPQMISLPMYFSSSPHSTPSSAAASPSLSAYADNLPFSRPISHATESSSSTATVSSESSETLPPRSMPPLRPRPSFDPLTLPSFLPADFASERPRSMLSVQTSGMGRRRSVSHPTSDDYTYTAPVNRAGSQPPSSPTPSQVQRGYSALTSSFASLNAAGSRKVSPVDTRMSRASEEVQLEMRLFRD
ncbi:hypothetical protein ANO11243_039860 [Dothideomycetidae sp. 11243]|nr:hypothetical protein ANO11243_039860 [fungal sp. No.11243]